MEDLLCAKHQTNESEQECNHSSSGDRGLLNRLVLKGRGLGAVHGGWSRGCCGSIQNQASLATLGGLGSCLEKMDFNMRL